MRRLKSIALISCALCAPQSASAVARPATDASPEIRTEPIAGIYNALWYSYLADIREAEQELGSDLKHSTDAEDRRDAWDEYYHELVDADKDYVKEMRKRGHRVGRVTVG